MSSDHLATPSAKTVELAVLSSPPRGSNLPETTTRVIGRSDEIDQLRREVHRVRLASIVGAGGVGKTTVALAVAELEVDAFPDGTWLVDFAPLRDSSLVPHAIAGAVGLVVHSANVLPALCRYLRERRLLLVLDNCEHMLGAITACLDQIIPAAPGVHVLATSRSPLGMKGEQAHTLSGLRLPPSSAGLTAAEALAYPAVELFVARATDRLETFAFSDEHAPAVAEICRSLDGIALAIELAAMRVDAFGVNGLRKQLADRFRVLAGRRAGLERHRTLAATLDWSFGLLSESEASLLLTVSVFVGPFRLAGAAAVAHVSLAEATVLVGGLASKSLLSLESLETDAVDTTCRLLETTRVYCLEKLAVVADAVEVRHRHARYVCAVLERAVEEWGNVPSPDWGRSYGPYLDEVRAALGWTGSQPHHRLLLIRLTAAATLLWNHFSLTDESRIHLTRALAELGEAGLAGSATEMNLQFALVGALLYTRGVMPEARVALRRALQISEQLGDTDFRLRCLRLTATFELFSGEHHQGIRTLELFSTIATAQDPTALAEGETHLGCGEYFVGRLRSARERVERLYARHSQDFNDPRFARFQYSNSVNILIVLCHVQWLSGSPDAAAHTAETVVEYGRQAKHELSLSIALAWVCLMHFWRGDDLDCGRYAALLDELVERHGIVTWRPIATFCRGALAATARPDSSEGIEALRRALDEFRAIGHNARLPFYIGVMAEQLGKRARFEEAEAAILEAWTIAQVQSEAWCQPELLRIQASLASDQGRDEEAERLLLRSITISKEIGARAWELRSVTDLAVLWQRSARRVEGRLMLRAAYEQFTEGHETRDLLAAARLLNEAP